MSEKRSSIKPRWRGLAREVYAMVEARATPDKIHKFLALRFRTPKRADVFIKHVRANATIGEELAAFRAKQAPRKEAEEEARTTFQLPAPSDRAPLPSERVTLCETITWIGRCKARKRHRIRKLANRWGGYLPVKVEVALEQAQRDLMTALRKERLPLFGRRREKGSGDVDDSMEKVPIEWLMEPVYFVPLDDEIVSLSGSAYVAGTLRRSDLMQIWGADSAQTSAVPARPVRGSVSDKVLAGWIEELIEKYRSEKTKISRNDLWKLAQDEFKEKVTWKRIAIAHEAVPSDIKRSVGRPSKP